MAIGPINPAGTPMQQPAGAAAGPKATNPTDVGAMQAALKSGTPGGPQEAKSPADKLKDLKTQLDDAKKAYEQAQSTGTPQEAQQLKGKVADLTTEVGTMTKQVQSSPGGSILSNMR